MDADYSSHSLWGSADIVTYDELVAAQQVLRSSYPDVLRTPVLPSWPIEGMRIDLKLESLQTTGSFKIRGMRYKLHTSDLNQLKENGVVTLSAGNAGKAVSYLAQSIGIDAKIYMPDTAPEDRKILMEEMGATVVKVVLSGLPK